MDIIQILNEWGGGVLTILTMIVVFYTTLKTKLGQDFVATLTYLMSKGTREQLTKHDERLDNIDRRLLKGDNRFEQLANDIKQGDIHNKEVINGIDRKVDIIITKLICQDDTSGIK